MATSKSASQLKVTPLHDRVIVKPAQAEEKTAGGIIIPDTAKEKTTTWYSSGCRPRQKKDEPVTVKKQATRFCMVNMPALKFR